MHNFNKSLSVSGEKGPVTVGRDGLLALHRLSPKVTDDGNHHVFVFLPVPPFLRGIFSIRPHDILLGTNPGVWGHCRSQGHQQCGAVPHLYRCRLGAKVSVKPPCLAAKVFVNPPIVLWGQSKQLPLQESLVLFFFPSSLLTSTSPAAV